MDRRGRRAAVAIGSNVGDRVSHVAHAVDRLRTVLSDVVVSTLLETVPDHDPDDPLFLNGALVGTTQEYVGQCLELLRNGEVGHWEVETYAWEVLPDKMKQDTLADGIAEELMWLLQSVAAGQRAEGT